MSRICRFYHVVPKDDEKCSFGHYLCATLDCQVRNCKYTTRPSSISDIKPAIEMMKLHMIGAHPELKDDVKSKDKEDNENPVEQASSEPKKQEIDTNKKETCPKCSKIFFSNKNAMRHYKTQHLNLDRFKCSDCSRSFASKKAVDYHIKKCHAINSSYRCDTCAENFLSYSDFKKHSKGHKKSSEHNCDSCHASFTSGSNLTRHIKEVHNIVNINTLKRPVKRYPYRCDMCDFFTKRKHYFEQHKIIMHSPESVELLACGDCEKKFKFKQNLRRHEMKFHKNKLMIYEILNDVIFNLK